MACFLHRKVSATGTLSSNSTGRTGLINEMKVYVRSVELQSISAAARSLRLSPAAASHRILQLEAQLGTRLLNRTTRSLQMTEAGRVFYDRAREVLESVLRAESSVA